MNSIDTVVAYHNVVKKNQAVISQMPQGNLEAFCAAMAELQTAVDFFESNSPDSPELKKVSALFQVGKRKMIEYYDALLRHLGETEYFPTVQRGGNKCGCTFVLYFTCAMNLRLHENF